MRFMVLLLLFGCSTSVPLKYKYSSSKRYVASLTRDDVVVAKIVGELKDPLLFASGMDSTFLIVRLYDEEGNELLDVDPNDLTLSSSEDIEAKPFVRKQGVYKAELRPSVKGRTLKLRVDWREKVLSQEILLKTTLSPIKDELAPLHHEYFQSQSVGEINFSRGSASPETMTENFSIENLGDNRIVNASRHNSTQRVFEFNYPEQARQNLALEVSDSPNERPSHTMHSIFMFFPRRYLFVVEQLTGTINVTVPTGEKMIFQKDSKELVDGVFLEGPVDINSDRFKRQYPDLRYHGRGVVLRVNSRGQSPLLGKVESTRIDQNYGLKGSSDVLILNGTTGQRCRRPRSDFWEQIDVTPVEFKFPTDESFEHYLKKHCGFGLPKF